MLDIQGLEGAEQLPDPRHQKLYDYWLERKGARLAPARNQIDPIDFPDILPYTFIFKVHHTTPMDFELTLLGTALVVVLGRDFTGCHFDEMYSGDSAVILREQYEACVHKAQPIYAQLDADWMNKDFINYQRLLLPLSNDGERIDRLFGCSFFVKRKPGMPSRDGS